MEAFSTNTRCFLSEKAWLRVLRTAIRHERSFSDQQNWALALWEGLVIGPQALRETTDIIMFADSVEQYRVDRLVDKMLYARERLLLWLIHSRPNGSVDEELDRRLEDGLAFTLPAPPNSRQGQSAAYANQLALQGACLLSRILKARLLYALVPARFHHLEIESQELSERIVALRDQIPDGDAGAVWSLFTSQCNWVAKGILETKTTWSDGWQHHEGMIEKWKFQAWCQSIGSVFPSGS